MIAPLVILVLTLIIWEIIRFYRLKARLLAGPFAVPIVGNFFNEIKPPFVYVDFKRLSARFGSIVTVHMPWPVVNIADFETIRDTFKSNDVAGRLRNTINEKRRNFENGGIISAEGDAWVEQRRFLITTLREFGMGKNMMEEKVRLSAKNMADYMNKQDLSNIDIRWPIQVFVANIINEFLFGFQYKYDDCEKLMSFVLGFNKAVDGFSKSRILPIIMSLPWTRHLPIMSYYWKQHMIKCYKMHSYIDEQIKAVKFDPNEEPECYVQAFKKNNKDQRFEQLSSCCVDIFMAGQETTTITLRWAMAFLATDQSIQDKLRAEILAQVGLDRIVSVSDRAQMPYTNAVIHETQRSANLNAPNPFLFHKTTVDTEIAGYNVPAGTLVNGDIHQMMKSDPLFEDPHRFWPERYLAEDGITLRKELVERTIPFGIGKRQCAGEGLARTELFIGLVTLIQNFRVLPLPGATIDLEPVYLNMHFPKDQNFLLEKI